MSDELLAAVRKAVARGRGRGRGRGLAESGDRPADSAPPPDAPPPVGTAAAAEPDFVRLPDNEQVPVETISDLKPPESIATKPSIMMRLVRRQ
jgi:hypothetical protein